MARQALLYKTVKYQTDNQNRRAGLAQPLLFFGRVGLAPPLFLIKTATSFVASVILHSKFSIQISLALLSGAFTPFKVKKDKNVSCCNSPLNQIILENRNE